MELLRLTLLRLDLRLEDLRLDLRLRDLLLELLRLEDLRLEDLRLDLFFLPAGLPLFSISPNCLRAAGERLYLEGEAFLLRFCLNSFLRPIGDPGETRGTRNGPLNGVGVRLDFGV